MEIRIVAKKLLRILIEIIEVKLLEMIRILSIIRMSKIIIKTLIMKTILINLKK